MRNNGGMTSVAAAGATAQREERKTGGSLPSCSPAAGESCSSSWAKLFGSGTDLVVDNGVLWDHIRTPYNMQGSTNSGEMKDGWMNSAMSNEITWNNDTNDALKKLVSTSPAGSGAKNINGNGLPNPNSFDSLPNYGGDSNNAANATGKFIFQGGLAADSYPCGSFTRLLDPSTTLDSADNMELGLVDFSSSGKGNPQVQHQQVSSQTAAVPFKNLATAAFQSSNILTFHSNMSKMDMAAYCAPKPVTTAQNQKAGGSPSDSSPSTSSSNNTLQKSTADEGGECTTEQKRSSDQAGLSNSGFKKPRTEASTSASAPTKVKKEKLGERITALQQLVSPFGKTDTASVLLEAMGYIKFLQDQVQVLSTPYLKGIPSSQNDQSKYDLRSRGLCLVPVSCTVNVANNNGADFWTSGLGSSAKF